MESRTAVDEPRVPGRDAMAREALVGPAFAFVDYLPLDRLYARFSAIANGTAYGDSHAAHQAVLDRLRANRRFAEALGWIQLAVERRGGSGPLQLLGCAAEGAVRSVAPDRIPALARNPLPRTGIAEHPPNAAGNQARFNRLQRAVRDRLRTDGPAVHGIALERTVNSLASTAFRGTIAAPSSDTPEPS